MSLYLCDKRILPMSTTLYLQQEKKCVRFQQGAHFVGKSPNTCARPVKCSMRSSNLSTACIPCRYPPSTCAWTVKYSMRSSKLFVKMIGVFGYTSAATLLGPNCGGIYGMSLRIREKMPCMYAAMLSAFPCLGMELPAN